MIFTGKNQTLTLETGRDLAGVSSPRIRYRSPGGETGNFTATVDGTALKYKLGTDDVTESGTWQFQADITSGSDRLVGDIVRIRAINPIPV
jgi:hypothetical protein